ncbi:hypothetical protein [Streptomyces sp. NPDC007984]|uniref:hypothetical protein n=1 Tax=Streptomyces sp. NPDC007984 TaxID=3364801 RepID=UPI0036E3B460
MFSVAPQAHVLAEREQHHLLLIRPLAVSTLQAGAEEVPTIVADIVDLTEWAFLPGAQVTGPALVAQLRAALTDGLVLGRLGYAVTSSGARVRILAPHTGQDARLAEKWLAENPGRIVR